MKGIIGGCKITIMHIYIYIYIEAKYERNHDIMYRNMYYTIFVGFLVSGFRV